MQIVSMCPPTGSSNSGVSYQGLYFQTPLQALFGNQGWIAPGTLHPQIGACPHAEKNLRVTPTKVLLNTCLREGGYMAACYVVIVSFFRIDSIPP